MTTVTSEQQTPMTMAEKEDTEDTIIRSKDDDVVVPEHWWQLLNRRNDDTKIVTQAKWKCVLVRLMIIGCITVVLFLLFGIITTALYQDLYQQGITEYEYFHALDDSLYTLFEMMTLDNWSHITRQVMTSNPTSWLVFVPFVVLSSFCFVQGLIVYLCDGIVSIETTTLRHELMVLKQQQLRMEQKMDQLVQLVSKSTTSTSEGVIKEE